MVLTVGLGLLVARGDDRADRPDGRDAGPAHPGRRADGVPRDDAGRAVRRLAATAADSGSDVTYVISVQLFRLIVIVMIVPLLAGWLRTPDEPGDPQTGSKQ